MNSTAPRLTVLVVLVVLVVMACLGMPGALRAQISPGPLAKAHAKLEGSLNCARCHGPRKGAMTASCLSCHKEISWLVERNRGYHASRDARAKDCASCHPDHAGADFALIAWPGGSPERFDHRTAGWALEDGHLELKCQECHAAEYRSSEGASLLKRTTGAGWTGLETSCASCHRNDDEHRGALDARCDACHDSRDWKRAPRFSHDSTDYALTGKHSEVECNACHLSKRLTLRKDAQRQPIPVYSPVPFRGCADCHDDPHRGRLSSRCGDCHTTKGFEAIEGRAFNHNLTRYPLKGRHGRVSCAGCHGPDLARPKPAFDTCEGCHSDPHNGKAVLAGKPADCGACHRVDGFSPSSFTIAQHASSPYPLEGRHAQVACMKCHTPSPMPGGAKATPVARLRMPFGRCADCHVDSHGGQLAARTDKGACERCHAVAGWTPSTYSVARHAKLRLRLEGRHAEIPCRACHGGDRPGLPAPAPATSLGHAAFAISLTGAACADCHVDPHAGRYDTTGPLPTDGGCGACHSSTTFRPSLIDAVRHDRFAFQLKGAHRAVACVSCHEELKAKPGSSTLLRSARGVTRFPAATASTRTCATCHGDPHGEQFASRKNRSCESCHGVDAFAPAPLFDHERDASFSLRGAHAKVACARCHVRKDVGGAGMTVYRPVSGRCESCHDKRGAA